MRLCSAGHTAETASRSRRGRGDEFGRDGYTGMLRTMMATRGWEVVNQSRGGDNTRTMMPRFSPEGTPDPKIRYLTTVNPSYVIIGLSLGNEGLFEAKTRVEKEAVYKGYGEGIKAFVDHARQNNIVPIVTLCYTRAVYTPKDHEFVRRMNVQLQQWDVPTVNFLGATDDGQGRWSLGWDDKHPQASGFREMFYTFVPTLFEALEQGKPVPTRASGSGFARVAGGGAPFVFAPEETVHPFASVGVQSGKWAYRSAAGTVVDSGVPADSKWHQVVLSHFTGWGRTHFYVDGKLAGSVTERLEPKRFVIGGAGTTGAAAGPKQADYKDVMLFRSALNADEVAALHEGKLLSGSLEIYAPLMEPQFAPDALVANRAQSLTSLKVGSERIVHMSEAPSTN